jgi:hypothetical protein
MLQLLLLLMISRQALVKGVARTFSLRDPMLECKLEALLGFLEVFTPQGFSPKVEQ